MWTQFFLAPAAAVTILSASPDVLAVDLKPKTLAAFDRYVKLTEAENRHRAGRPAAVSPGQTPAGRGPG